MNIGLKIVTNIYILKILKII